MALSVNLVKRLPGFTLNVSFTAEAGVTALLGASGSGKSMTLRCIAGVEKPDEGSIVLDGCVLYDSKRGIDLPPQNRRVGYLFQRYALFPNMTVRQNIDAGLSLVRDARARKNRAKAGSPAFIWKGSKNIFRANSPAGRCSALRSAACSRASRRQFCWTSRLPRWILFCAGRWRPKCARRLRRFPGVALLVSHDRGEVYRMSGRVCVLNAGISEPVMPTRELFERPRTLQAALISGCKNCAPAKRMETGRVQVPNWNAILACEDTADQPVTHIGVRAHWIIPCEAGAENAVFCRVLDAQEDVFTRILTLLPAGGTGTIRAELSKEASRSLAAGNEAWFCLPWRAVMLLMEADSRSTAPRG